MCIAKEANNAKCPSGDKKIDMQATITLGVPLKMAQ
jgi:hypothetical protein